MSIVVRDLVAAVEKISPSAWAEAWDNVGLLVGDPSSTVEKLLVTLDPIQEAIDHAVDIGADAVVSHHPLWLGASPGFTPGSHAADVALRAASTGLSLIAAHTNLDRAPGACDRLVEAIGLPAGVPLERGVQPVDVIVTFVPEESAQAVRSAMRSAGAGDVGRYEGCSFSVDGTGRFTPGTDTHPTTGSIGAEEVAVEARIEMVAPRGLGERVASAAAAAHPYEEPLVISVEGTISRGVARMGRVSRLDSMTTLGSLAEQVASRLSCTPRVWGDPESSIEVVGVTTGSGGSLIPDAIASNAHVLIAGEVRYHDALDAQSSGVCVIEAGHDVTEWPLVSFLGEELRRNLPLADADIVIDTPRVHWWTA